MFFFSFDFATWAKKLTVGWPTLAKNRAIIIYWKIDEPSGIKNSALNDSRPSGANYPGC